MHFGREIVVEATASGSSDERIRRMLVDPRRVPAGGMNDAEGSVDADEVPRIYRGASIGRITFEFLRIDRGDTAFGKAGSGRAAVQLGVVDVDALIVVGGSSERGRIRYARPGCQTSAGLLLRRIERAVEGDVIVKSGRLGRATRGQGSHARKRIRGLGRLSVHIIDSGLAQCGEIRAVRRAAFNAGNSIGAVVEIYRMHAVDAQQQNVLDFSGPDFS